MLLTVQSEVVRVPGGRFTMGSAALVESDVVNPPHIVTLSPFGIGRHPVTNGEYRKYVEATGASRPTSWGTARLDGPDLPVVGVSWDDALAYCTWAGGTFTDIQEAGESLRRSRTLCVPPGILCVPPALTRTWRSVESVAPWSVAY
jgi:formylglycine-generating enzyme required for sulfatase activity